MFRLPDPAATYRIKVYGTNMGGTDNKVLFNGDAAAAVTQEARTRYYDEDNSLLQGGVGLFWVTVPEKFRRVGQLTVVVQSSEGLRSNPLALTFQGMALKPLARPLVQGEVKAIVPPPTIIRAPVPIKH